MGRSTTTWGDAARSTAVVMFLAAPMIARAKPIDRPGPVASRPAVQVNDDLATLATVKPRPCPHEQPIPAIGGWSAGATQCAWQDHLQMRQWQAIPAAGAINCVDSPARWWGAVRHRWGVAGGQIAWNSAWPAQTLSLATPMQQQIAILERTDAGTWMATEWRWTPSPRAATRQWQQGRWNLLVQAAALRQQKTNAALVTKDAVALLAAWETILVARAGEIGPDGWRWESAGTCMRMETAGISQAQLHLPYSREDSRLEQRAAMQLRLARTYPKANWLIPFRILPAADALPTPAAAPRSGAMYQALWWQDATVKGQLWMPEKTGGAIHRARISVALEAPGVKGDDPRLSRIAVAIERELAALAAAFAAGNER